MDKKIQPELDAKNPSKENDGNLKEAEDDAVQMIDKMINWDYANKVKDEFLAIYPRIVSEIRPIYFTKILKIMNKANTTFKVDSIIEITRKSFLDSLNEQFNNVWVGWRLAFNLTQVNAIKLECKLETKPKWRPTGKTVAEQTIPVRCRILEAKKNFIFKQWELQNIQLQSLVVEIEKNRNHVNELIRKREELLFKMDVSSEKLADMKKRYKEMISKICNNLRH